MKMLPSIFTSLTWIVHLLAKIHFFFLQNHILGACKCFRCSFHLCFCFKLREILKSGKSNSTWKLHTERQCFQVLVHLE